MKRNSAGFLALFLSASMAFSPALAFAGEPTAETVSASAEVTADPVAQTVVPEPAVETEVVPVVSAEAQELPEEAQKAETEEVIEETKDDQEIPEAAEGAEEETVESDQEEADPEEEVKETEAPAAVPSAEGSRTTVLGLASLAETAAEVSTPVTETAVKVVKADGTEFKMFAAYQSLATLQGDEIEVLFVTKNTSYTGIYVGSLEDAEKSPVAEGSYDEAALTWTFRFRIPAAAGGQKTEICLRKKDGTFYSNQPLYLDVPELGGSGSETPAEPVTPVDPVNPTEPTDPSAPTEGEETPSAGMKVVYGAASDKAGQEFGMFRVEASSIEAKDGSYILTISTAKTTYHRIHLGTASDAEPYAESTMVDGVANDLGGYTFTIVLPESAKGQNVDLVPIKSKDGTAYVGSPLVLEIPSWPEMPAEEPEETPGEEEKPSAPIEDGTYNAAEVTTGNSMFRVVNCKLTSKDDKMTAEIALSGTGYDYLYMGTPAEAFAADESTWIPFEVKTVLNNETGEMEEKYVYTIPVEKLDTPLTVAARSAKSAEAGKGEAAWYAREITISSSSLTKVEESGQETQDQLEDGIYNAPQVLTGNLMFRVVNCQLTSGNGEMTAEIALSGTGYDYLYMGTPAEAFAADESFWIPFEAKTVLNNETGEMEEKYVYTIPVEKLDTPLTVAARSAKNAAAGKGEAAWYAREITISSEGLVKVAELPGSDSEETPENPSDKPETKPETKPEDTQKEETPSKPAEESKHEADTSGSTSAVDSSTSLKDGVYSPDSFSFNGGSGKVSISCSQITIKNGQAFATLIFSSASGRNKIEYVKANGQTYYTSANGGTRVVTIPVALNQNNRIIGMTTAMGTPHEVTYGIYIGLAAANGGAGQEGAIGSGSSASRVLDEKAPEIVGLTYEDETELEYAENFKLYHYSDGITLLEVDMTKDTARDPELLDKEEKEDDEEVKSPEEIIADLYMQNIVKYLIVPEEVEIPVGLEKEVIVIQLPADKSCVASEDALKVMKDLELLDQITSVGFEAEELSELGYEELSERMKAEEETDDVLTFAGTAAELDFSLLEEGENNLVLLPESILPAEVKETEEAEADDEDTLSVEEQTERLAKMALEAAELGIPMLVDRSGNEKYVLGTCEWLKVYGAIFGVSDKTDKLFDEAVKEAKAAGTLKKENEKPEK